MKHLLSRDGWSGVASVAGTPKPVSWTRGEGLTVHAATEAEAEAILGILAAANLDARTVASLTGGPPALAAHDRSAAGHATRPTQAVLPLASDPMAPAQEVTVAAPPPAASPQTLPVAAPVPQEAPAPASAPPEVPAPAPQESVAGAQAVPEKIARATQIRQIIAVLEEQGVTGSEAIIRECERLKATGQVALLTKVSNVTERVTRALDVMGTRAS